MFKQFPERHGLVRELKLCTHGLHGGLPRESMSNSGEKKVKKTWVSNSGEKKVKRNWVCSGAASF